MALYNLSNPYDLEKFKKKVADMERKGLMVELKTARPQRTLSQNSYLHVLLGYFASEFGYTASQVKQDIFKLTVNPDLFVRAERNKRGEEVARVRSTTELTTEEMSEAITRFRDYSSSECGLYLPSASEDGALFYARQQAEAYKHI